MAHFPTLSAFALAVQMYVGPGDLECFPCDRYYIGKGRRKANKIEHCRGGCYERRRSKGKGEDRAQVVFVLRSVAGLDSVMAAVVGTGRDFVD